MTHRLLAALLLTATASADGLRVLTWNVESSQGRTRETNDPTVIARELAELQESHGPFDLIGLTEVRGQNAERYAQAIQLPGKPYQSRLSETGGTDRMLIAWSDRRFTVRSEELALTAHDGETFPGGNNRRPMFVTLADRANRNQPLTFMVNHLNRGTDQTRQRQARMLRGWVQDHPYPVIAVGDYNFDFDTVNLCGNQSMSLFLRNDANDGGRFAWRWVVPGVERNVIDYRRPMERVEVIGTFRDTNWVSDSRGRDRYPTSILDYVFLAGDARSWKATSSIIVRDGDFPDDERTSDHRPVMAVVER